jgi:hypothetical protein
VDAGFKRRCCDTTRDGRLDRTSSIKHDKNEIEEANNRHFDFTKSIEYFAYYSIGQGY